MINFIKTFTKLGRASLDTETAIETLTDKDFEHITLDPTKEYKTRSGKTVIGLQAVPYNSTGARVGYPIKGTIIIREKPLKTEYNIWRCDGTIGVAGLTGGQPFDLIPVN